MSDAFEDWGDAARLALDSVVRRTGERTSTMGARTRQRYAKLLGTIPHSERGSAEPILTVLYLAKHFLRLSDRAEFGPKLQASDPQGFDDVTRALKELQDLIGRVIDRRQGGAA